MKVLKWLDDHFEESLLIFLLAVISCVELLQVVCRNVEFIPALTWTEELCRYAWVATVFISLGYTIRTNTMLKVNALVEAFPWKVTNFINILVDFFTALMMGILSYYSVIVFMRIAASGETSPAMVWPMWIMYLIVMIGFMLGTFRAVQMGIIHIKTFNVPPLNSNEEAAKFEVAQEKASPEASAISEAFSNPNERGGL